MFKSNYMFTLLFVLLTTGLVALAVRASGKDEKSLPVVPSVDLSRYAGLWYEFARLPNKFEDTKTKTCSFVTAEYTLRKDGRVGVINRCRIQSGKIEMAKGIARITDKRTNARLEVNFAPAFLGFLPFVWGDYNIIELAPDYSSALIGNLDRKGLWVLSRKPQLEEAIYQQLLDKAAAQGFDVSLVKKTKQTE